MHYYHDYFLNYAPAVVPSLVCRGRCLHISENSRQGILQVNYRYIYMCICIWLCLLTTKKTS